MNDKTKKRLRIAGEVATAAFVPGGIPVVVAGRLGGDKLVSRGYETAKRGCMAGYNAARNIYSRIPDWMEEMPDNLTRKE